MIEQLPVLRELVTLRASIEAEVKRTKEPIAAKLAELASQLELVKEQEDEIRESFHVWYDAGTKARTEQLALGNEVPKIQIPEGFQVRTTKAVTVADPDLLPRSVLSPDLKKIKDSLVAGPVKGVTVSNRYTVAVQEPGTSVVTE